MTNRQIDIPISLAYRINGESLGKIKDRLANAVGCEISEINERFDNEKGYTFFGPYQTPIADLVWNNGYDKVRRYDSSINKLRERLDKDAKDAEQHRKGAHGKKTKFKLQKGVAIGVAITLAGMTALVGTGIIKLPFVNKEPVGQEYVINRNTIVSVDDLVLYDWLNYAMGEVTDAAYSSENEKFLADREYIYQTFFVPTMSSYYDYLSVKESDLPYELVGDAEKQHHNNYRNMAYQFDEVIQRGAFSQFSFEYSPYANAVVVDSNGDVLKGSSEGLFGEITDVNGQEVIPDGTIYYQVYVRAIDIPNNNYDLHNLPEDAIMIEGIPYVPTSHLLDFEIVEENSMSK